MAKDKGIHEGRGRVVAHW